MRKISDKIKKIFNADQKDRVSAKLKNYSDKERWGIIGARDRKRLLFLVRLLKKKLHLSGADYFRAAMIFQHGSDVKHIKKAQELAKKGMGLENEKCRWLYAAATDRILMMKGKKQKFGTQFKKNGGKWELHPVQPGITDAERRRYNVLPLRKIKIVAGSLNRETGKSSFPRTKIGLTRLR